MSNRTRNWMLALVATLSTACAVGGPTSSQLEALRPLGVDDVVTTDDGWLLLDRGEVRGRVVVDDDGSTAAELGGFSVRVDEPAVACLDGLGAEAPLPACLPAMHAASILTREPALEDPEVAARREPLLDDLDGCLIVEGCVDWEAPDICWHWLVCKVNCGLAPGWSCHYEM